MPKWIIASNRLPFGYDQASNSLKPSSGGLVTAISGIRSDVDKVWVGVTPEGEDAKAWRKLKDCDGEERRKYHPIIVDAEVYDRYYNGMCNNVLWPILHYASELVEFNESLWRAYTEINQRFAEEIVSIAEAGDMVWVHDFHLFLLPQEIKKRNPNLKVGFFLHTPFPSSEVFRQLPVRERILDSVLSSDLVGFHDYSYLRHFISSMHYLLGWEYEKFEVRHGDHRTQLGVFPVSIDTAYFQKESASPAVKIQTQQLRKHRQYEKIILGVDRLDYIKGIELKLRAFGELLEHFPELQGKVGLVQIAVPSRVEVTGYVDLKARIERLVGEINGRFGRPNYVPIQYLFSSIPFHELLALYQTADVLFVSSKRDGMNLVALEYIAAQRSSDPGVVVLSEFTGATSTLSHVIHTNPWDREGTARNLRSALMMEQSERRYRHGTMIRYLENYTATRWADSFMTALDQTENVSGDERTVSIHADGRKDETLEGILQGVNGEPMVLFLDYDGTMVPICDTPEQAILGERECQALRNIVQKGGLEVVVVSGRDQKFLSEQLGGFDVSMASEHGSRFFDRRTRKWKTLIRTDKKSWYPTVKQLMSDYSTRVPGSFIEQKRYSVAWHYRKAPAAFGSYQARKLRDDLESALHSLPVQVLSGKKVIEARAVEASKGAFANWFTEAFYHGTAPKLFGIGDDETDEDLFSYLEGRGGIAVKVGSGATRAPFRLSKQEEVFSFLNALSERCQTYD